MRRIVPVIKSVVTLAAIAFIVWAIAKNASGITKLTLDLRPDLLLLGLTATVVAVLPLSLLWTSVVRPEKTTDPRLNLAYAKANLIRYIPGNIFGLGARVVFAAQLGVPKSVGAASLLTEGVYLLASTGALALFWLRPALAPVGLVVMPLAVALLAQLLKNRPAVPTPRRTAIIALGAYAFGLGLGLALAAFASAAHLALPVRSAIGVFGLAWFLGYVSLLTPSGLGVREATIVVTLTPLLGAPAATFLSLASRLAIILAELLVAFGWWLAVRRQRFAGAVPPS